MASMKPPTTGVGRTHGIAATYGAGCRCDSCRAANTLKCRERRDRRVERGVPPEMEHGLSTYTNYGCRCEVCRSAHVRRMSAYYRANPDKALAHALRAQSRQRSFSRTGPERPYSLDALAPHEMRHGGRPTWHEITGDSWSDPTFDAVCDRLDAQQTELRAELARWNGEHRQPRSSIDTTDPTKLPAVVGGVGQRMSPKRRNRAQQKAVTAGKHLAKKARSAA